MVSSNLYISLTRNGKIQTKTYFADPIHEIVFLGHDGDDELDASRTAKKVTAYGHDGDDILKGGRNNDIFVRR